MRVEPGLARAAAVGVLTPAGQRDQRITLVALTGWGQDSDRRRSREAGFDSHLVKPLDLETLTDLLARLPSAAVRRSVVTDGAAALGAKSSSG